MPNSQFELIWYATMNITNQCIDLHRKHPNLFRNQIIALNALLIKIWSYRIIHSNIANWHIVFFQSSIYLYFDKNIPKLQVSAKSYDLAPNYIDEKHTRQWNKKYNDPYSIIAFLLCHEMWRE